MVDVSIPTIRELKETLVRVSLIFIGQHLWSLKIMCPGVSQPIACLCKACEEARKAYQKATGEWPTGEQEIQAMKNWGDGK